jgi:hypothetical protein
MRDVVHHARSDLFFALDASGSIWFWRDGAPRRASFIANVTDLASTDAGIVLATVDGVKFCALDERLDAIDDVSCTLERVEASNVRSFMQGSGQEGTVRCFVDAGLALCEGNCGSDNPGWHRLDLSGFPRVTSGVVWGNTTTDDGPTMCAYSTEGDIACWGSASCKGSGAATSLPRVVDGIVTLSITRTGYVLTKSGTVYRFDVTRMQPPHTGMRPLYQLIELPKRARVLQLGTMNVRYADGTIDSL